MGPRARPARAGEPAGAAEPAAEPAGVAEPTGAAERGGSALEVLSVALRLGLTSFGGPIAHIGYFRREYVERRRWLDERAFGDLVALCQFLPGPASSELGIAIGTRRAGIAGGLAAWLGFTLPSAIALVAFATIARSANIAEAGWVHGLKIAAVAVVALALWSMARALTPDWPRRAMAVAAAAVVLLWTMPIAQVAVIAGGAVLGRLLLPAAATSGSGAGHGAGRGASGSGLGRGASGSGPIRSPVSRRFGAAALVVFFALLVALPVLGAVAASGSTVDFAGAFYRAGALVFGGGHVVLPLLHGSVVDSGWVSNDLFLAGYGAAQAVPGPLFTFSAYLGAVATAGPGGVPGAAVALVAMFLPAFLLVWGVLPFWDSVRAREGFRRALAGTNAAVVGILAAALYTPIWTSAVARPVDAAVAGIALATLASGRVPPIAVVALCAAAGQVIG